MIGKSIVVAASALCFALFAGCATTTNPVSVFYSPSTENRGGSGYLFLRVPSVGKAEKVRWVIGKQKDADGEVIGEVLSANSREDIVADALKRELTAAGYRVSPAILLIRSGRVRAGYRVGERLFGGLPGTRVLAHLIGERPGSGHHTFSIYLTAADGTAWGIPGRIDHQLTRVVSGIALTARLPVLAADDAVRILQG